MNLPFGIYQSRDIIVASPSIADSPCFGCTSTLIKCIQFEKVLYVFVRFYCGVLTQVCVIRLIIIINFI